MTLAAPRLGSAFPAHLEVGTFVDFAAQELAECPMGEAGVCFLPQCSQLFDPNRKWQTYCSDACRRTANAEFRAVGQRLAPALLVYRMGKHEGHDGPLKQRTNAARRFIGRVQSAWLADRGSRVEIARAGQ